MKTLVPGETCGLLSLVCSVSGTAAPDFVLTVNGSVTLPADGPQLDVTVLSSGICKPPSEVRVINLIQDLSHNRLRF